MFVSATLTKDVAFTDQFGEEERLVLAGSDVEVSRFGLKYGGEWVSTFRKGADGVVVSAWVSLSDLDFSVV